MIIMNLNWIFPIYKSFYSIFIRYSSLHFGHSLAFNVSSFDAFQSQFGHIHNKLIMPCFHNVHSVIEIENNLKQIIESDRYLKLRNNEGKFLFCKNCTINCYFDPSFLYKFDSYFFLSLISKAKYAIDKYITGKIK